MTNADKYANAFDRAEAFCNAEKDDMHDKTPYEIYLEAFKWLERTADNGNSEPLPCPFCGKKVRTYMHDETHGYECQIFCSCGYNSPYAKTMEQAIAAHNSFAMKYK